MTTLRNKLIRLAYTNPGRVRDAVLPILKAAGSNDLERLLEAALSERFPDADWQHLFGTAGDIADSIEDGMATALRDLLRLVEGPKPRPFKVSAEDTAEADPKVTWERQDWWIKIEIEHPSEVTWTTRAKVDLRRVQAAAVKDAARGSRLDPRVLLSAVATPAVQKAIHDLWVHKVKDLKGERWGAQPVHDTMIDWWQKQVHTSVDWDDDAPFHENPVQYDWTDRWEHSRVVTPTADGFEAYYFSEVNIDIKTR